jgi:hypothetical protein
LPPAAQGKFYGYVNFIAPKGLGAALASGSAREILLPLRVSLLSRISLCEEEGSAAGGKGNFMVALRVDEVKPLTPLLSLRERGYKIYVAIKFPKEIL